MSKARRFFAFAASLLLLSGTATAQTVTKPAARDLLVQQAIADTFAASMYRRGMSEGNPQIAHTLQLMSDRLTARLLQGAQGLASSSAANYWHLIKALDNLLPSGMSLAAPVCWNSLLLRACAGSEKVPNSDGSPSFGGGGNSQGWIVDCTKLKLLFDAEGNLIIPSYALDLGKTIALGAGFYAQNCFSINGGCGTITQVDGVTSGAAARRAIHLRNMTQQIADWMGVIGPDPVSANCWLTATVARRDPDGNLISRVSGKPCNFSSTNSIMSAADHGTNGNYPAHKACPESSDDGGTFHFYGETTLSGHMHGCVAYYPNPQLSPSGYAINDQTTILYRPTTLMNDLPAHLHTCPLSQEALKDLTDALFKDASQQLNYDGVPYQPINTLDARPDGARVADLGDNPGTASGANPGPATLPNPGSGSTTPPDPDTPTSTPSTGGGDECDFKATTNGCTDPGVGSPTLEETHSNLMDPIFNWLPDLPSITMPTQDSQCPVWNIDLRDYFGGANGQFLLNSHCTLMDDPDLSAALGSLMIALFGITAAMIVLRA